MHVIGEANPATLSSARERPDHNVVPPRSGLDELSSDRSVATPHQVAVNRVSHRPRHNDSEAEWPVIASLQAVVHGSGRHGATTSAHGRPKVFRADHPIRPGEQGRLRRELGAPLATAGAEDGAACAGAHAQTETVHLSAAPIVRLEGSLGHADISKAR